MASEVSPKSNRLFIVIGVILAAVAFLLVMYVTRNASTTSSGQTQNIVVAKVDLAQGVPITAGMLDTAPYPLPIPSDAVIDPGSPVGQTPNIPVKARSPITQAMYTSKVTPLGPQSLSITKNYVAMAIPTTGGTTFTSADLENMGNYVQPEDHIDILVADATGGIRYSFQDVRVLRVGVATGAAAASAGGAAAAPAAPAGTPSVLIIELPRNQAELMTYLITRPVKSVDAAGVTTGPQNMVVKYVLRPREEYGKANSPPNYESSTGIPVPPATDGGAGPEQLNGLFAGH